MSQGIYCYIDKKNNFIIYIGKDSYIDKNQRHISHFSKSHFNHQKINKVLQNNPNRYKYKILEQGNISPHLLNSLEICFIHKYNPKFNFTQGGDGIIGFSHSEETLEKMRKNNAKYWKGKTFSKRHKEKISNSLKGERHYRFGKHCSEEIKKKISLKLSSKKNTSGFYRVYKVYKNNYKQGFYYCYRYYNQKGERKQISSVDIKKLEYKVKEKGLPWIKL